MMEHVEDVHLARMPRNASQIEREYPTLEEISTQNGPPKENNKIIVKITK